MNQGELYHRGCYLRDIKCVYCEGPILASQKLRRVLDGNYHPKCFICTGCSKQLVEGAPFQEVNGWPFCPDCLAGMGTQSGQSIGCNDAAVTQRCARTQNGRRS
jgi:hypothetical protein